MTESVDTRQGGDERSQVVNWIRETAISLKTVEAGSGFDDLHPLKRVLAGARLVGLGEATHGTREFFQCKHRLLEFLAQEMGFTVFAIEASYVACVKINDYVLYGQGDPAKALAGQGFWTWDTEEVAAMIRWMREYNLAQPAERKLKFYGYDVQTPDLAIAVVRDYMARVAPERAAETDAILALVEDAQRFARADGGNTDPEKKAEFVARLYGLIGWLAAHATRLARLTSGAEYENALQHARILLQFEEYAAKPHKLLEMEFLRDRYMSENIEYIARVLEPGAKIVVWGQNAHVCTLDQSVEGGQRWMGNRLREVFGPAYYVFGFTFNEGSFQARAFTPPANSGQGGRPVVGALTEFTLGPAPEGYIEWYFSRAQRGDCIVDFRQAPTSPAVSAWLAAARPVRNFGGAFSYDWPESAIAEPAAPSIYDGLIHIERTTRARPNPTGIR